MSAGRGKAFEAAFSKALKAEFGDNCFRIPDGDARAKVQMPGDFIAYGRLTWLIECKSTVDNSFPFRNVQEHQLVTLTRWEDSDAKRMSLIAIHYARHGRMFLLRPSDFIAEMLSCGRKSLTVEKAAELGIECKRKGGIWSLGMP